MPAEAVPTVNVGASDSAVPPTPAIPEASTEASDELTVNYMGLGQVTFKVTGIELTNTPPDETFDDSEAKDYLLITFDVLNIDVPPEEEMAKNALINCFDLYAADAPEPYGSNSPWLFGPDYFSDVIDPTDIKSYFRFSMPDIGESRTLTLGWSLDSVGTQLLEENKISLTCTFAQGTVIPINYDDVLNNIG